jgi:hypothetical protein
LELGDISNVWLSHNRKRFPDNIPEEQWLRKVLLLKKNEFDTIDEKKL